MMKAPWQVSLTGAAAWSRPVNNAATKTAPLAINCRKKAFTRIIPIHRQGNNAS
jgi:hypothetical protein